MPTLCGSLSWGGVGSAVGRARGRSERYPAQPMRALVRDHQTVANYGERLGVALRRIAWRGPGLDRLPGGEADQPAICGMLRFGEPERA